MGDIRQACARSWHFLAWSSCQFSNGERLIMSAAVDCFPSSSDPETPSGLPKVRKRMAEDEHDLSLPDRPLKRIAPSDLVIRKCLGKLYSCSAVFFTDLAILL